MDRFKGYPKPKTHPFLCHNFSDFIENEACTKFCGVLISSHEVVKLQSSESGLSDIIPANI